MKKPKAPKLYRLKRYLDIIFIALFVNAISRLFNPFEEAIYIDYQLVAGSIFVSLIWLAISNFFISFKEYEQAYSDYMACQQMNMEAERKKKYWDRINSDRAIAKISKVNANIEKYLEELRIRRSRAKWWQLWI